MARSHILIFLYNRQKNKYIIYTAESCLPYKAKAITSHQLLKIKTRCFVISILSARCFINSRTTFKEKEARLKNRRTYNATESDHWDSAQFLISYNNRSHGLAVFLQNGVFVIKLKLLYMFCCTIITFYIFMKTLFSYKWTLRYARYRAMQFYLGKYIWHNPPVSHCMVFFKDLNDIRPLKPRINSLF